MKKIYYLILIAMVQVLMLSACTNSGMVGMPNPWIECGDNLECAAKKAGFKFPLVLSNYQVRAMDDMIEITYPLDEVRNVVVRKCSHETDNLDISGVYTDYPIKDKIELKNEIMVNVRRDTSKIYVAYFAAESGVFSIYCEQGISAKELQGIFDIISEAETSQLPNFD